MTVAPANVTVTVGATQAFTAQVHGTSDMSVTWSVDGGTIDATGLFHAPSTPGTFTVTATSAADTSVHGSATVTVTAELLTVMLGAHVTGSPAAGVTSHAATDQVSFGYGLDGTLTGLTVEVDGTVASPSGMFTMDQPHWLWAFGQPTTGTTFNNVIAVPNDPTVVPMPAFYASQPSLTQTVADPYCAIESNVIVYPRSYLGAFPIPAPTGAPLAASTHRGVFVKDYWRGNGPANNNVGCTGTWETAVTATLQRLKRLGADHVIINQSIVLEDISASPMHFDCWGGRTCSDTTSEIPDADLVWVAQQAQAVGLEPWLFMQVATQDSHGVALPTPPSSTFANALFDAYIEFMTHEATVAEAAGYKVVQADWTVWTFDWTQAPYKTIYQTRMADVATAIRSVFSGKIALGMLAFFASDDATLMSKIDLLIIELFSIQFSTADNQAISTAQLVPKYTKVIDDKATLLGAYHKPALFRLQVESFRDSLLGGFVEDGFCMPGCIQNSIPTDFSVQAIAIEAELEAIKAQTKWTTYSVDVGAYWWTDVILPAASFPNLSHSIRNKPAESIVYRWFR